MASDDLRVEGDPRLEDVRLLDERLYEFNAAASGVHDGRSLAVFVREADDSIAAGLHGWTWGGTGFVQTIWVREDLRLRGVGKRLRSDRRAPGPAREQHPDFPSQVARLTR
jgi:hypothetical protein